MTGLACVELVARGDLTTGELGLVLLYAASLQRAGMDYMCGLTTLEAQFVSVERVSEYVRLLPEEELSRAPAGRSSGTLVASRNASASSLSVRAATLRYRLQRPLVLRGVSFDVAPGQKVAVCGRTGSGKSSLFAALARLYPLSSGSVTVDGQDLDGLSLADARAKVRVVSQDATRILSLIHI